MVRPWVHHLSSVAYCFYDYWCPVNFLRSNDLRFRAQVSTATPPRALPWANGFIPFQGKPAN